MVYWGLYCSERNYVAISRKAISTGGNRPSSHRIRLRAVYLLLFLSVRTNLKRHREGRYLHLNPHLYAHAKIHFDFSLALASVL